MPRQISASSASAAESLGSATTIGSSLAADAIFLASPSAVRGLLNQVEVDEPPCVYSIGPSTTRAADNAGLTVTRQAAQPSLDALIEAASS